MHPRRTVHTRGVNQPPPMSRTTEELNSLLEERIYETIAQYAVNHVEHNGGTGGSSKHGYGDSSGRYLFQGNI
ncbi:hypothetical protein Hanom_Chr09g00803141 [Helianthus anomalus]